MNNDYPEVLRKYIRKCDIFAGLSKTETDFIVSSAVRREYVRGDVVRDSSVSFGGIGFVLSGTASVSKGRTIISTLSSGDTFGAVDLFGNMKCPPSDIRAASDCVVACIGSNAVEKLIESNPEFAKNYIGYLCRRIAFLTDRIEAVTGGSAAEKLKAFAITSDTGEIDCSNMSLLAKKLDMSRATLYRAVTALEENKIIIRKDDKLILVK